METRSRKRAEASSAASSQLTGPATRSSKRARISPSSSSAAVHTGSFSSTFLPASVISTRSRNAVSLDSFSPSILPMDSTNESLTTSGSRRRGKNHVAETNNPDKGKEKEHEARVRARDKEVVLNAESGGLDEDDDEDDDYSEGGVGVLHHNLTTASSALQGLLRKLGAGLDDLLPSTGAASGSSSQNNGRFKKILSGLRADGEEGRQIEALSQLCDMILLMGTEDSLSTLSVDSFVPVLVGLLNYERNPDIMLLAARAITHLCDFLPSSCAAVVHYGAVSPLCERLLTIEYMDLAEQCLQALKKISQEHPTACLRAGALMAVLSYLDFFSTGVQRVALSTAANICKKLPADATDLTMEVVPILTNLLQYHDTKVLEDASICLTRIVESLLPFPEKLDEICNSGLVSQAASLISTSNIGGGQSSLSSLTYTGLIRLLFAFASGSPLGAKTLLLLGISGILKDALSGSNTTSSTSLSPALNRPPNQIFEIVNLANELLPPLPQGVISFSVVACSKGSFLKRSPSRAIEKQENVSGNGLEASAREKLLNDQPDILKKFGMDLLSVLIQIYGSSVNSTVRHKCLSVIGKLMYFSTADMIQPLITQTNIPSFLAGILAWKDPLVLVPALQIAEILMEKLPEIFSKLFVKEGVVHAVDVIISLGSPNTVLTQPILSEKNNEPGTSLRSSRYRRRSGISTSDVNYTEEPKASSAVCIDSPPLTLMDIPTANANLGSTICSCAKAFKSKYFSSSRGSDDVGVTDDFLRLKEFSTKLSIVVDDIKNKSKGKSKNYVDTSFEKEKILMDIICDMLNELNRGDGVSTFEFIGSGVVTAFLNYFSCGHFFKEKASDSNLPILRQQALKRFKSFVCVALSSSDSSVGGDSLMAILIQKLQNALSSLDCFPVVLSHSSRLSTGSTQTSTGLSSLSSLSQPFKLRLCREQGDKSLRDFSSNIVLIDPLASIASIEDFLFPRVQRVEPRTSTSLGNSDAGNTSSVLAACSPSLSTPSLTRRQSTRSRSSLTITNSNKEQSREKSLSNSKGKGKVVVKPSPDQSGPQTRNAIRRKAALDKDTQGTRGGDSSSEELGISPCDIDGVLVIQDENISDEEHVEVLGDDLLPVCTPGAVHDVKLGDMGDDNVVAPSTSSIHAGIFSSGIRRTSMLKGLDSNDFRNGGLFGSQGAMSFAAAAMAGLASSNGRSIKGDSDILGRNDPPRLKLSAGGKTLNRHMTIYQAIQRQFVVGEEDDGKQTNSDFVSNEVNKLWSDVYTITYQRADTHTEKASAGGTAPSTALSTKLYKTVIPSASSFDAPGTRASLLDSMVQGELPCDLEKSNPTYNILALLRVLEGVNQLSHRLQVEAIMDSFAEGKIQNLDGLNIHSRTVPSEAFLNSKLTPKLTRQIQDALALCSRSLPSWCYQLTKACPFLFPFETRRQYFYSTAFGLPRALYRLQLQQGADGNGSSHDRGVRLGRLERQKVRVSRNHVLDSAIKVMEIYSSQKSVLEVEYFGEVGTGLGPTLEFYTLLSHDLQKVSLGLWRCDKYDNNGVMEMDGFENGMKTHKGISGSNKFSTDDIVRAPLGLFPRPWPPNSSASEASPIAKVVEYFHLLGRVMAKALQDGRLLDLPISTGLYKILLGHELDLHDIFSFDSELGKTLQQFQALVYRKNYLESMGSGSCDAISSISFYGVPIKDLCLDFTLPGYPDYVLKSGDDYVDISNLEEYVSLVVDATVKTGIKAQVDALRAGFNQVVDISSLQIFSPHELDNLLCGLRDSWEVETLTDYIKFDHGFTAKSPPILNLLEIMGEFTVEQQRAFCRFVTGAPRLPPGGLAVLNPKLTIVRKNPTNSNTVMTGNGSGVPESSVDMDLPSVMTCANYLKLPPYTTKEIMYNKLMYAITEGQGSFDLS